MDVKQWWLAIIRGGSALSPRGGRKIYSRANYIRLG